MSDIYTAEVVAEVVERYNVALEAKATYDERSALVKEIAAELGVKEASVRQKLVSEGIYVGKEKAATRGGASKAEIVKALSAVVGKDLASFEKASRTDLQDLWDWIVLTSAQRDAEKV